MKLLVAIILLIHNETILKLKLFPRSFIFYEADLRNIDELIKIIQTENISQVVHFLYLKAYLNLNSFQKNTGIIILRELKIF